jgi:hypothetical protein
MMMTHVNRMVGETILVEMWRLMMVTPLKSRACPYIDLGEGGLLAAARYPPSPPPKSQPKSMYEPVCLS